LLPDIVQRTIFQVAYFFYQCLSQGDEGAEAMNTETVLPWEQFAKASQAVVESMTRLQQIGARSVERLAQQQMGAASDLFELGVRQIEALSNVQGPEDLWTVQTRFATQVGEKWMANAGKFLDVYLENQAEVGRLFTEHMSNMTGATEAKAPAKGPAKGPAKAATA
jgi:phasin family protein